MLIEVKHSFSDALALRKQCCSKPFSANDFIDKLMDGAHCIYGGTAQYKPVVNSIKILHRYLMSVNLSQIIPDETFFSQVQKDLEDGKILNHEKPYRITSIRSASQDARRILNRYFLERKWISRKIVDPRTLRRFQRLLTLTPVSQEMILWFEANGKRIKSEEQIIINKDNQLVKQGRSVRFVPGELSVLLKRNRISKAIRFLERVKKNGFELVEKEDIDRFNKLYKEKQQGHTSERDMIDLYAFFANCQLAGFLGKNPFQNCQLKRDTKKARIDFLDALSVKKILDIGTLDWNDRLAVRDRLICALAYDCGFRRSELVQLKTNYIKELEDGLIRIKIDSFLQKGDKPTTYLYLLFRHTAELLTKYLKDIRPKFHPYSNHLFVNRHGNPLSSESIGRAVKRVSKQLSVKTFYGRTPSPHDLRHSLATLNIEPYGKLTLVELQKRMRHASFEILMDHYVHNNPLAERQKYQEIFNHDKESKNIDAISLDQVIAWMKMMGIPLDIRRRVDDHYQENCLLGGHGDGSQKVWIPESQILNLLYRLGIAKLAFRSFCRVRNLCKTEVAKGRSVYYYDKVFMQSLTTQYYPKHIIMKHYGWTRRTFFRKYRDLEVLKIGKTLLIKQDSLFQK